MLSYETDADYAITYVPPGPPYNSGLHRYVILIYKQDGEVDATEVASTHFANGVTGGYKFAEIADALGLELVAANLFEAEWDTKVDDLHAAWGWLPPEPYRSPSQEASVGTEEPETDCSDCVTQSQYDELYAMVEAQEATISSLQTALENYGALEATVDTVETQLTNLATCLSYDSGYEPEPTEPVTTERMTTSTPTPMPTALYSETDLVAVCESGANRSFKVATESAEECAQICAEDSDCVYFSRHNDNGQCIGCDVVPNLTNSFTPLYTTFRMFNAPADRRRLSELELLRAENEALKAALERARRN